ncbi:hypothetical protein M231_05642 [Tremella mesenterica]|uniref:Uncharacterized protein n=1 Tax=Tremella mesenterica TaxID=5217 RepID=A0A4Q1BHJ2_TREME|nr:hypothetical protein M231_05642 [Tremella mesenterica]
MPSHSDVNSSQEEESTGYITIGERTRENFTKKDSSDHITIVEKPLPATEREREYVEEDSSEEHYRSRSPLHSNQNPTTDTSNVRSKTKQKLKIDTDINSNSNPNSTNDEKETCREHRRNTKKSSNRKSHKDGFQLPGKVVIMEGSSDPDFQLENKGSLWDGDYERRRKSRRETEEIPTYSSKSHQTYTARRGGYYIRADTTTEVSISSSEGINKVVKSLSKLQTDMGYDTKGNMERFISSISNFDREDD